MPQSLCILNGYAFTSNAVTQKSVKDKMVSYTKTLGNGSTVGGYFTIRPWYPQDRSPISLEWPLLNATQYEEFMTLAQTLTPVSFTDWNGNTYQVIIDNPSHSSILRGNNAAYTDVKLELWVYSGAGD